MSIPSNDPTGWSFPRSVFTLTLTCPHCPTMWHSELSIERRLPRNRSGSTTCLSDTCVNSTRTAAAEPEIDDIYSNRRSFPDGL